MGKYMRKCKGAVGEEVAAMEVTQAVGVRTRSRAAAVAVAKRRRPLPPSPLRAAAAHVAAAAAASSSSLGVRESGSCYLKLRSRMLFMAPPPPSSNPKAETGHAVAPAAAGLSRCSSTASSVDASSPAQDRSLPCSSDAAEAGSDNIRQGSANNNSNSESGRDHRERRETTPSSHQLPGELSDLESDLAGRSGSRSLPSATTPAQVVQLAPRPRMPEAAEIEEFFAAVEEAEAKRFASKYNFDVARGVPLDAGRFEWAPAVSS